MAGGKNKMIKLIKQEQLLEKDFRKIVIDELQSKENTDRKAEANRRYEVYKDKTVKWVVKKLHDEGLEEKTISLMKNRATNISICRKIIDKKSQTYLGSVQRESSIESKIAGTPQIALLEDALEFNENSKKSDRWLELFKNTATQIVPVINQRMSDMVGSPQYDLKMKVFSPAQYDVLPFAANCEEAGCVILSEFTETNSAQDKKNQEFIWWSDKYHFTTDSNGDYIQAKSPIDKRNPINLLPFAFASEDQNGSFWADGGQDLVDAAILVNTLLTDINSIAYMQGWGQIVITGGEGLPKQFTVGPHNALVMTYDKDKEPEPKVSVVSPTPPIEAWLKLIEQYVALVLSTNNLSPSNISIKLDPANFPSGVAMMIEQSQSTESVIDKQAYYRDIERNLWEIIFAWQNLYYQQSKLTKQFSMIGPIPEGTEVKIKFEFSKAPISEKEKLENIKIRKELGINEEIDLIMIDNPDLNHEEAEEKLLRIKKEKLSSIANTISASFQKPTFQKQDQSNQNNDDNGNTSKEINTDSL